MSRSVSHYSISAFRPLLCASENPVAEGGSESKRNAALGFFPPHARGVWMRWSLSPLATKQPLGRNDGSHSGVKRGSEPPANEQGCSRRCKINGTLSASAGVSMNRGPAACLWQMECAKYQRAVIQKTTGFDKF